MIAGPRFEGDVVVTRGECPKPARVARLVMIAGDQDHGHVDVVEPLADFAAEHEPSQCLGVGTPRVLHAVADDVRRKARRAQHGESRGRASVAAHPAAHELADPAVVREQTRHSTEPTEMATRVCDVGIQRRAEGDYCPHEIRASHGEPQRDGDAGRVRPDDGLLGHAQCVETRGHGGSVIVRAVADLRSG